MPQKPLTLGLIVREVQCETCIYRPDSPLDLRKLEDEVRGHGGAFDGFRACHAHTTHTVCCRGFWDRHAARCTPAQIAQRTNSVDTIGKGGDVKHWPQPSGHLKVNWGPKDDDGVERREKPARDRRVGVKDHEQRRTAGPTEAPFTTEQLAWLEEMLTPRCCHIVGLHDSSHFEEDQYVCEYQMTDRYQALREALGLSTTVDPKTVVEADNCSWCRIEQQQRPRRGTQGAGARRGPES